MNKVFVWITIFFNSLLSGQELRLELKKEELDKFYSMKEDSIKHFGDAIFSINGRSHSVRYSSHGKSDSYNINRKSFELKFEQMVKIKNLIGKRMVLSGSAEDYFMVNNAFSLKVLQRIGLSDVDFSYGLIDLGSKGKKLFIMATDPVESMLRKNKEIVAVFRTDYNGKLRKKIAVENISANSVNVEDLLINKLKNVKNEKEIEQIINVDQLLKWIAINRILRNCDYEDELFFGVVNNTFTGQVKIAYLQGWDYEQIACSRPNGESKFDNADLFFGEQSFWVNLVKKHHFLQQRYQNVLSKIIFSELTSKKIDLLISEIKKDLKDSIGKEIILNNVSLSLVLSYLDYLGEITKIEVREILKTIWKSNV